MPDVNLTLNLDNVVMGRQGEASIASEVFQTLLGCMYQRVGAFEGIFQSIMVYIVPYLPRKIAKMPDLGCNINIFNGVMVYNKSHSLLLKCLKTLLGCL